MLLNATLWHIFVEHQIEVYSWELLQNNDLQMCQLLALCGTLHRYLSISCYNDVTFNFYYFIAVPIGKTLSMPLMSNCIFYILFYFIADFKQVFTMI